MKRTLIITGIVIGVLALWGAAFASIEDEETSATTTTSAERSTTTTEKSTTTTEKPTTTTTEKPTTTTTEKPTTTTTTTTTTTAPPITVPPSELAAITAFMVWSDMSASEREDACVGVMASIAGVDMFKEAFTSQITEMDPEVAWEAFVNESWDWC